MSKKTDKPEDSYKFKLVSGKNYILTDDEKFANQFIQSGTVQVQTRATSRRSYSKRQARPKQVTKAPKRTRRAQAIAPMT